MSGGGIGIIGAGPVGSVLAARLIAAGQHVTVCEVNARMRARLTGSGITVAGTPAVAVPRVIERIDGFRDEPPAVLFLAVKAPALPLICDALSDVLQPETTVVSWQNGIDTERVIAASLGADRTVRAVINQGVSFAPDGSVVVAFEQPPHYVQEVAPAGRSAAESVATLLTDGGVPTQRAENLVSMVWRKAILNAGLNALCALTGMNMREAWSDAFARDLAIETMREGVRVARANEIMLGWDYYQGALDYLSRAGEHKPSMLLDREAGRRTEIDFINGKIVEYGEIAGVPTPHNKSLLALVKAMERKL